jgi:hypothetical protein
VAQYLYYKTQLTKTKAMKNSTQTNATIKALDIQLKALLQQDLENFRAAKNKNNQANSNQLLAA